MTAKSDAFTAAWASYEAAVKVAPARHAFVPRLAEKGRALTTEPDALGRVVTLQADEHGIVRPESVAEVQAADALGLPAIPHEE